MPNPDQVPNLADVYGLALDFAFDYAHIIARAPRALRSLATAIGTLTVYTKARHRHAPASFSACHDSVERAITFFLDAMSEPSTGQ